MHKFYTLYAYTMTHAPPPPPLPTTTLSPQGGAPQCASPPPHHHTSPLRQHTVTQLASPHSSPPLCLFIFPQVDYAEDDALDYEEGLAPPPAAVNWYSAVMEEGYAAADTTCWVAQAG